MAKSGSISADVAINITQLLIEKENELALKDKDHELALKDKDHELALKDKDLDNTQKDGRTGFEIRCPFLCVLTPQDLLRLEGEKLLAQHFVFVASGCLRLPTCLSQASSSFAVCSHPVQSVPGGDRAAEIWAQAHPQRFVQQVFATVPFVQFVKGSQFAAGRGHEVAGVAKGDGHFGRPATCGKRVRIPRASAIKRPELDCFSPGCCSRV